MHYIIANLIIIFDLADKDLFNDGAERLLDLLVIEVSSRKIKTPHESSRSSTSGLKTTSLISSAHTLQSSLRASTL